MENIQSEVREEGVQLSKDYARNPYGETVLYLGNTDVNILAVICTTILQDVTLGKTGRRVHGISLYYFLQLLVTLQLSQHRI